MKYTILDIKDRITKFTPNEDIYIAYLSQLIDRTIYEPFPDWLNIKQIDQDAFAYCDNLTSVTIPDSVTTINYEAFAYCDNLTSVTIPDSVTTIGAYAFRYCTNLTNIMLPNHYLNINFSVFDNTAYYNDINNWDDGCLYIGNHLVAANKDIVGSCVIKNDTLSIIRYCFRNCESLTSITIPNSIIAIPEDCFEDCTNLINVEIPNSVARIGYGAFSGCTSLKSISIPSIKLEGYVFQNCTSLLNVTIGKNLKDMSYGTFDGCSALENIYMHCTTPPTISNFTNINNTFIIHVPVGSEEAYKSATNWSQYADRIVGDIILEESEVE